MKTKTIGIVGSRRRNNPRDYKVVRNKLLSLILSEGLDFKKVTLISGGCPEGADDGLDDGDEGSFEVNTGEDVKGLEESSEGIGD